jgi:hypothetical protein
MAHGLLVEVVLAVPVDDADRRHHHARGAEPALQRVVLAESLLHGVQFAVPGQPFNGRHVLPFALLGENGAGLDRQPVQVNGAGAALAGVATDVGAGQADLLAQVLDEERTPLYVRGRLLSIDRNGYGGHPILLTKAWRQ